MRFKEIISTQRIIDTKNDVEYRGLVEDGLFEEINKIADENEQLKQREETLLAEIEDFQDLLKQADEKIDCAVSIIEKTCPEEFVSKFKEKMWRWD